MEPHSFPITQYSSEKDIIGCNKDFFFHQQISWPLSNNVFIHLYFFSDYTYLGCQALGRFVTTEANRLHMMWVRLKLDEAMSALCMSSSKVTETFGFQIWTESSSVWACWQDSSQTEKTYAQKKSDSCSKWLWCSFAMRENGWLCKKHQAVRWRWKQRIFKRFMKTETETTLLELIASVRLFSVWERSRLYKTLKTFTAPLLFLVLDLLMDLDLQQTR